MISLYKTEWCKPSYDFMSKDYKHALIQKVTFSTKKELLTQPYTRKHCIMNTAKQCCVNTPISMCIQRSTFLCPHRMCLPFFNNLLLTG